jgi:hypothetical protein
LVQVLSVNTDEVTAPFRVDAEEVPVYVREVDREPLERLFWCNHTFYVEYLVLLPGVGMRSEVFA